MSTTNIEVTENKFSPENLRLSQDFSEMGAVKKHVAHIFPRRPKRQEFFRVHPDPAYYVEVAVLDLFEEGETYVVAPALYSELAGEAVRKLLAFAITKQGVPFLWPIRLPDGNGNLDPWNTVAAEAAKMAMTKWIKLVANKSAGTYDIYEAVAHFPDPEWPDLTLQQALELAFRDRYIDSLDHPVLKKLRGEV